MTASAAGSLIGNWPQDMILLFNRVGEYCQREHVTAEQCEAMFNAGIVARAKGALDEYLAHEDSNA